MPRISRRQLGLATLAGAAVPTVMAQSDGAPAKYDGALEGFENKVDMAEFDPVVWTKERYRTAPLQLTFRAENRKQAEAWQKRLRPKIVELVGGFPAASLALSAKTLEVRDFPTYRRERVVFESRPGLGVLAYLITPKNAAGKLPVVVSIPGHGRGVDDIAGIDEKGQVREDKPGYQHDFALQAAEHGMASVAIEPMAFGCRRDPLTKTHGPSQSACQPTAGSALLLGETMIGWRVYDIMRTVDWIATRPELDSARLGVMGISGGGTASLFSAALDTRIKAAFVSGYLNTFRDSIMSVSHCIDNYVPGILNWAEMYDVAGLIAPRPLFAESGDQDKIFPLAGSQEGFARVKKVYEVFGAPENVDHEIFSGRHVFHGTRGLPFLKKALG